MIQVIQEPVTFDDFITWYLEQTGHRYELHDGAIYKCYISVSDGH